MDPYPRLTLALFVLAALAWQPTLSQAQPACLDYNQYPLLESSLELPGESFRMARDENLLYVAAGTQGLQVVDFSDSMQGLEYHGN